MISEITARALTLSTGKRLELTEAEHEELETWFCEANALPLRTANPPPIYLTQTPSVPPEMSEPVVNSGLVTTDPPPGGEAA